MDRFILEPERRIPVYKEADVLIVGGGPAGLCAAVSAARSGASVVLMERYGYLGGMATGGYVLLLDCLDDGKGNVVIKGLVQEMIERLRAYDGIIEQPKESWGSPERADILKWRRWGATGGEDKIVRYSPVVDPEMMKCAANDMALESGVDLLLHAWFSRAIVEDGAVKGAIFDSKSGRLAVRAKVVIDCTGDGDVFHSAGEDSGIGNLPLGVVFRVGNLDLDTAEAFLSRDGNDRKVEQAIKAMDGVSGGYSFGDLPMGFFMHGNVENIVWFNNTIPGSAINIADLARAEVKIRQAMIRTVDYFKQNVPGFEKAVIIDTAPQVGTRGTRLLKGEYVITRKELNEGAVYEDAVVMAQPPYRGFEVNHGLKQIPYRSFLPKKTKGLLVAGRCLSGDFGAMEMLRVIPTAMLMGQACGTAAAMAVNAGVDVKEVNIKELQTKIKAHNVLLP
jgi:ribulose 1,5-bisphosphate synthetase/thiazole synthase